MNIVFCYSFQVFFLAVMLLVLLQFWNHTVSTARIQIMITPTVMNSMISLNEKLEHFKGGKMNNERCIRYTDQESITFPCEKIDFELMSHSVVGETECDTIM